MEKLAGVRSGERALVLTDFGYSCKELANMVFENSLACGAESAMLVTTPPTGVFPLVEMTQIAKATADTADIVFGCTSNFFPPSMRKELSAKGKRVLMMHLLRDDIVLRTVPVDMDLMQRRYKKLLKILPQTEEVHLTSERGTDMRFSLKNCKIPLVYDGICHPGEVDAVPGGTLDTLPVQETGNGTVVIDGSLGGYGLVRTPIKLTIKRGEVVKIEGGPEAEWVDMAMKKALVAGDRNANHWAEFLIGLNPNAQITGYGGTVFASVFEDERRLGAVSIGWGRDDHLGGQFGGEFHVDAMVKNVTITLDDITVIRDGAPTEELS